MKRYRLHVSRNAGMSYRLEKAADTLAELDEDFRRLDEEGWRWYVEDTRSGECIPRVCAVFERIGRLLRSFGR